MLHHKQVSIKMASYSFVFVLIILSQAVHGFRLKPLQQRPALYTQQDNSKLLDSSSPSSSSSLYLNLPNPFLDLGQSHTITLNPPYMSFAYMRPPAELISDHDVNEGLLSNGYLYGISPSHVFQLFAQIHGILPYLATHLDESMLNGLFQIIYEERMRRIYSEDGSDFLPSFDAKSYKMMVDRLPPDTPYIYRALLGYLCSLTPELSDKAKQQIRQVVISNTPPSMRARSEELIQTLIIQIEFILASEVRYLPFAPAAAARDNGI